MEFLYVERQYIERQSSAEGILGKLYVKYIGKAKGDFLAKMRK